MGGRVLGKMGVRGGMGEGAIDALRAEAGAGAAARGLIRI